MNYQDFESIMSQPRMQRYLLACNNDTRKAMTLYRLNLKLSQELFTVIGCFEVALRNKIDALCLARLGADWLRNAALPTGIFGNIRRTQNIINKALGQLNQRGYNHQSLLAALDFGFWRYMYSNPLYAATHRLLLGVFPLKPRSTPAIQYNQTFIFNTLKNVNDIRNRIAHHEPICFGVGNIKDTTYAQQNYNLILQLFQWMNIDASRLLYGLDHINEICSRINSL